jgi:hypothetical protein
MSIVTLAVLIVSGLAVLSGGASASAAPHQVLEKASFLGLSTPAKLSEPVGAASSHNYPTQTANRLVPRGASGTGTTLTAPGTATPPVGPSAQVVNSNPGLNVAFNGLGATNSSTVNGFDLEPPDQGLCTGNGSVIETVNLVMQVYSTSGTPLTAQTNLNNFFLTGALNFVSDPRCYYDSATQHFFSTVLLIDANNVQSAELIAVTVTSDPTGSWYIYAIDTSDNGRTGCPCFGDQPLLGADSNGFYVTSNEYPISGPGFFGAQIYALSKPLLEAGIAPVIVHIDASSDLVPYGGLSYSVEPATVPAGGTFAHNTEYFLSALQFTGTFDNRIAIWDLTGTNTLSSSTPTVKLHFGVITSEVYGQPVPATQKAGPTPLAHNCTALALLGQTTCPQPRSFINPDDDRMLQVVWADGQLWSSLNTLIDTASGNMRVGAAYFVVDPIQTPGAISGTITTQGYVWVTGNNVIYPAIGVNPAGKGVMVFTLSGGGYHPSVAYIRIGTSGVSGPIHIVGAGVLPADGFTGYLPGFGNTERWGDYSAAVAGDDGSIWIASEYVPGARDLFTNWGTYVADVTP